VEVEVEIGRLRRLIVLFAPDECFVDPPGINSIPISEPLLETGAYEQSCGTADSDPSSASTLNGLFSAN